MTIWAVLGIEPTTDKKIIKRAYAARSKVIHPEEKPEEFQMLYRAYQAALQQAKNSEKGGSIREFAAKEKKEEPEREPVPEDGAGENSEKEELLYYFEEQNRLEEERIAAALEYLKELWKKFREQEEKENLPEYFHSAAFRSIQWHPQAAHFLAEEFSKLSYARDNETWQLLWDLYGFQEGRRPENGEEVKRLWRVLDSSRKQWEKYQAYQELREKDRRARMKWDKLERRIRRGFYTFLAGLLLFFIGSYVTNDQRYIVEAMAKKYPGVEFSKPKWTEFTTGYYHFTSSDRPDMEITAFVTNWVHNGGRRILIEDYGVQVLGGCAEQYGLKAGMAKGISRWDLVYENSGILYYPADDLEELAEFCRRAYQMFQEEEELQTLSSVGFCMEGALYEEMMLTGGKTMVMVSEPQFFNPREMTAEELTQKVQEAYIEYRFNYEPWKLTPQDYKELGPEYEKLCGSLEGRDRWYELYVSGEWICGLRIRNLPHSDYSRGYEMSVGNVYYYLRQQGAQISVSEDGTGFDVLNVSALEEKNGFDGEGEEGWIHFGEEPYLEVDELKELLPAFDWKEESISEFEIYEQQCAAGSDAR